MKTYLTLLTTLVTSAALADVSELIQRGDVADQDYKPTEALESYLPAEKAQPPDAALLVKIARQYAYLTTELKSKEKATEAGRTAIAYSERAIALAPKEADPHLALAVCHGKLLPFLANREKIMSSRIIKSAAEKAVALDPSNDYAWHLLGRWHQGLANVNVVVQGLIRLIYGELPPASNDDAVRCFNKAIALNPDRLIHHIELGRTFALMGKTSEAKASIQKGLAMPNREKDDPDTKKRGRATLEKIS
jgi:tetratricopeptide (TPR) repeat protein